MGPGSQTVDTRAAETLPNRAHRQSQHGALPQWGLRRGQLVGRYIVLGELGSGAMGVVLRAYDPELDRRIALKVVRTAGRDPSEREHSRARLLREAQSLARLSHPNVVAIYDVGRDAASAGDVWIAMELVEGEDLQAWLAQGPRRWPEVLDVFARAGAGLHAAHIAGIVHRDFKPANVLVASDGRVVVTDFGLACPPLGMGDSPSSDDEDYGVTVGTPAYMAPEQHLGAATDARADQYSFCVALYEGLYGARPFRGGEPDALLAAKRVRPSEPRDRRVPRRLWPVIARGLSPQPEQRFASMVELVAALEWAASAPRRRATALAAATAIGAIGLAAIVVPRMAARADALCRGGEDRSAIVWNDARRQAITDAFATSGLPFAADASLRVEHTVDERAAAWIDARHEACAATWIRGEQSAARLDLRMACLDRRLAELDALLGVLENADAATVERASELAAGLSAIERCADPDALASEPLAPVDAVVAERVVTARSELDRVRALVGAGRSREAGELLTELRSAELDHPPLVAEIELEHGRWLDTVGKPARLELQEAARIARASDHRRAEAEAWIALVRTARREGDVERGRFAGSIATATLHTLSDDPELSAALALELGALAFGAGDDVTALAEFERALALREQLFGSDHVAVAEVLGRLAGIVSRRGDADTAIAMLERVLAIQRAALGEGHPRLGPTLGNLGLVHASVGRYEPALASLRAGEAVLRAAWGDDHPAVALAADSIGDVLRRAGRPSEALASFQRAIASYDRTLGSADVALAAPLLGLGETLLDLDRAGEARVHLERALALVGENAPPIQVADTRFALARALAVVGEPQRALELARQAEAIYRSELQPADDRLPALEAWLRTHARP